jgi:cobalamin biosynthesis Mg chelatase CobN
MLSHEESKKLLVEYLKKEFCSESLEFVEDVEELEDKLDDMTTQRLLGIIMMIFHTYISDNAPKEVNLPSEIKRSLVQKFRRTKSMGDLEIPLEQRIEDVELTKVENGQHIFSSAYIHVKLTMRENSFMRLINSKEFMSACSKSIPKCFVSQIPYAQPTVCKGV